jgi:hypothetical protein
VNVGRIEFGKDTGVNRAEYLRKLLDEGHIRMPPTLRVETPEWQRTLLREFEEEMREHGEPDPLRLRFYGYLQTAISKLNRKD